ncbi:MAG: hypothetical protein CMJ18_02580 [Phycisphaeraceae bacterium]|nr:hypothetical protein [Phycisphaeraceae bacterium]
MREIDVTQAQLFLDEEVLAHHTLVQRVVHQPVRYRINPVYQHEEPWEGGCISFVSGVYRDEARGMFRGWYVTHPRCYDGIVSMLCTIESDDGVHWARPKLDLCRNVVGGPSNVLFASANGWDGPTVLHDPDDAEHPWKIVLFQFAGPSPDIYMGRSPDGIHWTIPEDPEQAIIRNCGDRTSALVHRGADERYVILTRDKSDMDDHQLVRCIYSATSRDARTITGRPTLALRPDLEDDPTLELYQMGAFQYESVLIGLIERYHRKERPYADVELAVSRDARTWQRVRPRSAFFAPPPNGREHGAFDAAVSTPGYSPPILYNNQLWFYYYGGPCFHGDRFLTADRCIGLAKLRPDGFVSLRAGNREGVVTTRPFTWPGGRLQVNVRVLGGNLWQYDAPETMDGWMRVEVLDDGGHPIAEFTRNEGDRFYRDDIAHEPMWGGRPQDLSRFEGKRIALRFLMRMAEIHSFRSVSLPT